MAMIVIPTAKVIKAMAIIQSSIALADRAQRRIFVVSIVFGVVAALVAALLAWLVWNANNKYQEAVKADADARISESNAEAKRAGENAGLANEREGLANAAASKANERAEKLEGQNIKLRTDLESATAESRAKQAELATEQTKLATEQRKTAEAQREAAEAQLALKKHLEEVAKHQEDRHITPEQRARLIGILETNRGKIEIESVFDEESAAFAGEFLEVFNAAKWETPRGITRGQYTVAMVGVILSVRNAETIDPLTRFVNDAFHTVGIDSVGNLDASKAPDKVVLIIARKPAPR